MSQKCRLLLQTKIIWKSRSGRFYWYCSAHVGDAVHPESFNDDIAHIRYFRVAPRQQKNSTD